MPGRFLARPRDMARLDGFGVISPRRRSSSLEEVENNGAELVRRIRRVGSGRGVSKPLKEIPDSNKVLAIASKPFKQFDLPAGPGPSGHASCLVQAVQISKDLRAGIAQDTEEAAD